MWSIAMAETKDVKIKKANYVSQKQTDLQKGKKSSIMSEPRILFSMLKEPVHSVLPVRT